MKMSEPAGESGALNPGLGSGVSRSAPWASVSPSTGCTGTPSPLQVPSAPIFFHSEELIPHKSNAPEGPGRKVPGATGRCAPRAGAPSWPPKTSRVQRAGTPGRREARRGAGGRGSPAPGGREKVGELALVGQEGLKEARGIDRESLGRHTLKGLLPTRRPRFLPAPQGPAGPAGVPSSRQHPPPPPPLLALPSPSPSFRSPRPRAEPQVSRGERGQRNSLSRG